MSTNNVLIVSAFGRGHWLAVDLVRQGLSVQLLDVTESLGKWIPEDVEGPFGIFQSEKIKESQWERILEDDPPLMVARGFTIWLEDGPVELKGSTTRHRLEKLNIDDVQQAFINAGSTAWTTDQEKYNKIKDKPFIQAWLTRLSMLFSSNLDYMPTQKFKTDQTLPLLSNFFIRQATRVGHKKSLDWCRRNGVQVLSEVQVVDLAIAEKGNLKSVFYKNIHSEKTEQIEAEQFIWCLTGEETGMLGVRLQSVLFPNGVIEPEWIWTRYRIKLQESVEREQLPLHCLIISDLSLPWVHENFMVLVRTASLEKFDIWLKIPNLQRFNKEYLKSRGQKMLNEISNKIPISKPEILEYPLGYELTYKETGPSRNPIFGSEKNRRIHRRQFKNIQYHSIEDSDLLGWEGQLKVDHQVEAQIMDWWKKKLEFEAKLKAKQDAKELQS